MKALVLAAGRGERLRPLTDAIPKPLVEVGGRALIEYPLGMLKRAGITEIAINVHHLAGAMQSALGSGARLGIDIVWSPEPALFGTGGPLSGLGGFLGTDTFVVANSDTILNLDLAAMIAFHRDRGALVTLALAQPENLGAYSAIEIDSAARVRRMRLLKSITPLAFDDYADARAHPDCAAHPATFMYCGVIVAEPAVLKLAPPAPPWSIMAGLVAPMVRDGLPVFGRAHHGYMRTVDDLAAYERLRAEFAANPPELDFLDLARR
ncbi:MAG TPA: NDP-sugar synthase [Candidatus Binataceae bacterium]|nr:NDP-sugar synthase [Candidatus Binataceae bacterium]